MFVKKFEATSIEEALRMVKQELGPEALILSTGSRKNGWLGKPSFEITAALQNQKKAEAPTLEASLNKIFPHRKAQQGYGELAAAQATENTNRYVNIPSDNTDDKQIVRNRQTKYEEAFLRLGFAMDSSKELATRLAYDYPESDLAQPAFFDRARQRILSGAIQCVSAEDFTSHKSWAALGTAGSGRTSMLVKLALFLKRQENAVCLVGLDSRKLVGQMEMAAYARLLKIPFEKSQSKSADKSSLIDLPAIHPEGDEGNQKISELLEKTGARPFLVLDATARLNELMRQISQASQWEPQAIAFTKLDLAAQRGVLYDVLKKSRLPLLGVSLNQSFKVGFRFGTPSEITQYILRRGEL